MDEVVRVLVRRILGIVGQVPGELGAVGQVALTSPALAVRTAAPIHAGAEQGDHATFTERPRHYSVVGLEVLGHLGSSEPSLHGYLEPVRAD